MKNLMISTALVAFSTVAAQAQTTDMFRTGAVVGEVYASEFIGERVYASEADVEGNMANGVQDGWDDIGEINDVILSRDGKVEAVLVDIGGFLGMGERQVAVNMSALKFVSDDATGEDPDDYFLVMTAADANIQEAPEYDRMSQTMTPHDQTTGTAMAPAETGMTGADPFARDGYMTAEPEILTAERLTGARVYDANDDDVGEISELVLNADGQVNAAVIDVGGFLGMGEKPVSMDLAELTILRADEGDDIRVYVSQTKEQLEAMPDYAE
ncbi:PRC-barrel domain containing protein [Pseudorhodobacter turbinis]|uniref:PRC-barrel domain containing protein n=1 Tax=Pseudorhodobacter turbinis TaxID=2500533 RepID=A0A4P8EFU9_9RHOB|nr:PRC-barrel domain-containing protein [Pseudorhodobacter turbinis]QCO56000.1 PRC-barrel domain containing protein [Pseudorhodobacter turbinis]